MTVLHSGLKIQRTQRSVVRTARVQLFKQAFLEKDIELRRRALRQVLYKLFKRIFKEYYSRKARQRACEIDWKNIYCGEKKGLVSVVLPVYNHADLLEQAVEGVLNQDYTDFELIIVNDGSTDGVERVLDKYVPNPKVLIFTQGNHRLPGALNTGFSYAKGEFLTWTSADNTMLPNQLTEQVRYLRRHDFVHMVYCNYELMDERGTPFEHPNLTRPGRSVVNNDRDISSLGYTYNFINACFLYRSYVSRIVGNYDPDMYGAEDYDYWMRINRGFFIHHIGHQKPYYRYRLHKNTIYSREGGSAINGVIANAQALDTGRRSFFQRPMAVFIPRGLFPFTRESSCTVGDTRTRFVRFEGCKGLQTCLSRKGAKEKGLLFLDNAQLQKRDYQSILRTVNTEKSLCVIGIMDGNIGNFAEEYLELLDWIMVYSKEHYHALSRAFENKMLCLTSVHNSLKLCTIIANHRLYYKHAGRSAVHSAPEHHAYINDKIRIQ